MNTRLASEPRSIRRGDIIGMAVAGLSFVAALPLVATSLRDPAHVDQITIDNPHEWSVNVDVTDNDHDGWVGIGGTEREADHTFHDVLDQGDTWIFDFTYAGHNAELTVSRTQLERDRWRVTVPDELADQLRTANVAETPP